VIEVLNTRPQEQAAALSALLRQAGYKSIEVPLVELVLLDEGLRELAGSATRASDGILLSSPNLLPLLASGADAKTRKSLAAKPWYLISGRARSQVEAFGAEVAFAPKQASLEGFLRELPKQKGLRLIHLCSSKTRVDPAVFAEYGILVTNITVYAPHCPLEAAQGLEAAWPRVKAVLFASGSAVNNLFSAAPSLGKTLGAKGKPQPFSIGPSASEALQTWGVRTFPSAPTADNAGFIAALSTFFSSNQKP
jgi:uroporphyrinogen-III synthase